MLLKITKLVGVIGIFGQMLIGKQPNHSYNREGDIISWCYCNFPKINERHARLTKMAFVGARAPRALYSGFFCTRCAEHNSAIVQCSYNIGACIFHKGVRQARAHTSSTVWPPLLSPVINVSIYVYPCLLAQQSARYTRDFFCVGPTQ